MGGEGLKRRQLTNNLLMSLQGPHFCAHSTAKTNNKAQISGRIASIGISDAVVYSEKPCLKKLMIMIMNKSQETMFFGGCQKLTSTMKLRPEK